MKNTANQNTGNHHPGDVVSDQHESLCYSTAQK